MGHALARLPASVPAYALAPITYGKSDEHLHFPGTVTLDGTTLLETVTQIGESVYRMGFRKLLIVNGHGGQPQVMEMAARELRLRHGDYVVLPHFTWRVPNVAGLFMAGRRVPGRRGISVPAASSATPCPPPRNRARRSSTRWRRAGRRASRICSRCTGWSVTRGPGDVRTTKETSPAPRLFGVPREGYEPVLKKERWCMPKRPENLTDNRLRSSLREMLPNLFRRSENPRPVRGMAQAVGQAAIVPHGPRHPGAWRPGRARPGAPRPGTTGRSYWTTCASSPRAYFCATTCSGSPLTLPAWPSQPNSM